MITYHGGSKSVCILHDALILAHSMLHSASNLQVEVTV